MITSAKCICYYFLNLFVYSMSDSSALLFETLMWYWWSKPDVLVTSKVLCHWVTSLGYIFYFSLKYDFRNSPCKFWFYCKLISLEVVIKDFQKSTRIHVFFPPKSFFNIAISCNFSFKSAGKTSTIINKQWQFHNCT